MSDDTKSFHMSPEELRRCGYAAVDWIVDYYRRIESFPVLSQVEPGQVRAALPAAAPEQGEPFSALLADLDRIILPGITHWQSPSFFAFFPANASAPAILGELLSAGLGVQGMLWVTSPACTELESHVLDWLVDLLGLPPRFKTTGPGGGVIQDTASSAALCALVTARRLALARAGGELGRLTAYTSDQAHSSIEKAASIAGLDRHQLRLIPTDGQFRLRPGALAAAMEEDAAAGRVPFFACATAGTTSSLAVDPVPEIAALCRRHGAWLHVDAAMAGTAALCPELRWLHRGVELADSYCFNPHKWMFTNFDCNCFYVADRAALIDTLSVLPEYLRNQATESGEVFDYRDWQLPLGRRFRALKLWFVIRHYGAEGLRHHVREHLRLAAWLAAQVAADDRFELAAPVDLNLVCFRHRGGDEVNQQLLAGLNRSGALYLTHTRLAGRYTLRFCVGQAHTEARHVEAAWSLIQRLAPPAQASPETPP